MRALIVVVALGLLAQPALSAETTRSTPISEAVNESLMISAAARAAVLEVYRGSGRMPKDRTDIGLSADPRDTSYGVVSALEVFSGIVVVTFSDSAVDELAGRSLAFEPRADAELGFGWTCTGRLPADAKHRRAPDTSALPIFCSAGHADAT
ncbi:MAG: pilin [Pseudomonadota bacterium]